MRKLLKNLTISFLVLSLVLLILIYIILKNFHIDTFFYCYLFDKSKFYIPKSLNYIKNYNDTNFDVIIIGAGTSGSIIAKRLSQNESVRVLVIEAGTNSNGKILTEIPGFAPLTWSNTYGNFVWDYATIPQDNMLNRSIKWPAGKVIGGTSTINFMMFSKPIPNNYENWKNLTGCNNWNWESVSKYFTLIHENSVTDMKYSKLGYIWGNAWNELDYMGKFHDKHDSMFIKNGLRWDMVKDALYDASERPNVVILKETIVEKIIFSDLTNTSNSKSSLNAQGVVIIDGTGHKKNIYVKDKIILSAGPIQNVRIISESFETINDRFEMMGKNFKDQLFVPLFFEVKNSEVYGYSSTLWSQFKYMMQYIFESSGPFAQTIVDGGKVYLATEKLKDEWTVMNFNPDLQFVLLNTLLDPISLDKIFSKFLDPVSYDLYLNMFDALPKNTHNGFVIFVILTQPYSVGNLTFNGSFEINPNYLSDPRDISRLIIGLKYTFDMIYKTEAFKELNVSIIKPQDTQFLNYCDINQDWSSYTNITDTDDFNSTFWSCYIQTIAYSIFHYTGTSKFANQTYPENNQNNAVLDCDLKFKNTDNLYIVDSSVMPDAVSGGPQATTIMIAEKFADEILNLNENNF